MSNSLYLLDHSVAYGVLIGLNVHALASSCAKFGTVLIQHVNNETTTISLKHG